MKATIDYVKRKFDIFNGQMFGGKLPPIHIVLSNARTFSGQCSYRTRRTLLGKKENYDFKLKVSTRIDMDEDELDDIIIHEMIHYYIGYFQQKDSSSHGPLFRKMMEEINAKHGRHISVSHRLTRQQAVDAVEAVRRWHVVAVMSFDDGRMGIKVLPRVAQSILRYRNCVLRAKGVVGVEMFMTDNPFFNRFPSSSALKVHFQEKAVIDAHLAQSYRVMVSAGEVSVEKTPCTPSH